MPLGSSEPRLRNSSNATSFDDGKSSTVPEVLCTSELHCFNCLGNLLDDVGKLNLLPSISSSNNSGSLESSQQTQLECRRLCL